MARSAAVPGPARADAVLARQWRAALRIGLDLSKEEAKADGAWKDVQNGARSFLARRISSS